MIHALGIAIIGFYLSSIVLNMLKCGWGDGSDRVSPSVLFAVGVFLTSL